MRSPETPERGDYVLDYGRPRPSADGYGIIYERARLRADHAADDPAIRWAREVVPYERGVTYRGNRFLAVPMVLRRGRGLVWESDPGMALRLTG